MISLDELQVRDVMSTDPVCLRRETGVAEAIQVLVGRGLQGAPVVDELGDLVGVVSTSDLLAALSPAYREGEPLDVHTLHELKLRQVHALLQGPPITVEEGLALGAACQLMVKERVHRLVVTRDERPVGMFSAIDLVRVAACLAAKE